MLLLLLLSCGLITACFRIQRRSVSLLEIVGGGGLFERVAVFGGAARGRIGSRGTGGLGFLLFPFRSVSVLGFLTLFFFLGLLFLQALSLCIVRLALEDLSADELGLSALSIPVKNMGCPRSQNHRRNSFHAS